MTGNKHTAYVHVRVHVDGSVTVHVLVKYMNMCVLSVQGPSLVDMLHRIDELDVIPQLQVNSSRYMYSTYIYMYTCIIHG